jgi:HlyD family secretion protein
MAKRSKRNWIIGISVLVLAIIIGVAKLNGGSKGTKVATEKVKLRTIVETVSASGKVQPEVELTISPDVGGEIVEMLIKEGDSVVKGQLLARINPDLYNSDLDRTKASLENSKAGFEGSRSRITQAEAKLSELSSNYNRSKKLHDQKVISDVEWEGIQSAFNSAKAEVESAKQNLRAMEFNVKGSEAVVSQSSKQVNRTNVYAPMNGIVSKRMKEKGERVVGTMNFEGTAMMKIADMNLMEVSIDVNENDIAKISLKDSANIEVDAYPGRTFKGYVTEISNSANGSTIGTDQVTNFTVKVRMINDSYADLVRPGRPAFRPGMSASVDIVTSRVEMVASIPIESVGTRSDDDLKDKAGEGDKNKEGSSQSPEEEKKNDKKELYEVVFLYKNDKAILVKVKTGIQDDEYIQVKEGLKEGDEVIVAPYKAVSSTLKNDEVVIKTDKKNLYDKKK